MRCTNSDGSISWDMVMDDNPPKTLCQRKHTLNTTPIASVLQDSNTSRMKLLGSKAIPDGIETRQSLICFECSVHAWPERSVTIPGCISTALERYSAQTRSEQSRAGGVQQ